MIRLICTSCQSKWYTADTSTAHKCDDCGGDLKEDNESTGKQDNE